MTDLTLDKVKNMLGAHNDGVFRLEARGCPSAKSAIPNVKRVDGPVRISCLHCTIATRYNDLRVNS